MHLNYSDSFQGSSQDGDLTKLTTDDKTNLVNAINELRKAILDNEKVTATALTQLNERVSILEG